MPRGCLAGGVWPGEDGVLPQGRSRCREADSQEVSGLERMVCYGRGGVGEERLSPRRGLARRGWCATI